jgi:hypothetical protein
VARLLDWPVRPNDPDGGLAPSAYFDALRTAGRHIEAAEFLGQALPRWEAVAWAVRAVRDVRPADARGAAESAALKAALLWVQDPTENRRRSAFAAAEGADATAPERLAALAAFYSGGSVAPADCAPLPAPKEAAGRFAAGAVLVAALSAPKPDKTLAACLDAGVAMASGAADDGRAAPI